MIRFDPTTRASWKERGVHTISCIVTDSGCAGHKIMIREEGNNNLDFILEQDGLIIHLSEKYLPFLEDSTLTWTGKKWIAKSDMINTRCGCGSSFSLKSWNALQDRISQMKLAMKQKKEGVHM